MVGCFVLVVKSFRLDVFGCWEVVEFHVVVVVFLVVVFVVVGVERFLQTDETVLEDFLSIEKLQNLQSRHLLF